nr:alpha-amylase family glycosyl hydrolase [Thermococcus zilligii]
MLRRLWVLLLIALLLPQAGATSFHVPEKSVIYQVMVDRFYDGNTSNNGPFYDPTRSNYRMYWGGDLEGLIEKLDYIKSLGITEIWISPINDNINALAYGSAPYHGYWPRDFKRIEEHFGTWETFRKLVEEAEKRGMCIIVDYVPNHSNPTSDGEFGKLYDNGTPITNYLYDAKKAVINPYTGSREYVYHHNGGISEWYGFQLKYANLYDLADFNQHNPFVDGYLKEGAELFLKAGACGFRIDAVKHMDLGWLETFYLHLYSRSSVPLFIYGEYYNLDPSRTDDLYFFYQYSNVTSLLSIPVRGKIANTFAYGGSFESLARNLEEYYSTFVYPNKAVNFLDNHDLVRFLNMNPDKNRFHMALALTMTLPGIPVIYYGDESYLVSKDGKGDPYNRPMMVFNNTTEAARIIRTLAELRKQNDALAYGDFRTIHAEYSLWVFRRDFGNHGLVVVLNKGNDKNLSLALDWGDGTYTDVINGINMTVKDGNATLHAPKDSVLVFHREGVQKKPLIGSITPYSAQPGNLVALAGASFGGTGRVIVGGKEAQIISWSDDLIVFRVPEVETGSPWVDVYIKTSYGESNRVKLRYYRRDVIPVLVAIKGSDLQGYLWIRGNTPELAEPRPLIKSSTGYYFTVVPLPEGVPFEVEILDGLPWEGLVSTGKVYHGVANWTTLLEPGPLPRPTTTTRSTTTGSTTTTTTTTHTTTSTSLSSTTTTSKITSFTSSTTATTPTTTTTTTTTTSKPTTTTTTTTTSMGGGGICGPSSVLLMALLPLLKRRG